jgi:hypothetical protein
LPERHDRNDDPDNPYGGHRPDGLYVFGPKGERCSLAQLIAFSLLRVTASAPDAVRKRQIVYASREIARRREVDPDYVPTRFVIPPRMMRVGGFLKPSGKRPNSGRKRRVA